MRVALLALLLLLVAGPALAAGPDERARAYFDSGRRLSQEGRYPEALAAFSAGYELSHRPAFLINMGECARMLGDLPRARAYYQRYLEEAPGGDQAALARQRLSELPAPEPRKLVLVPRPPPPGPEPLPLPVAPPAKRSVWKSPWLWAGVGLAVVAGSVALYAATRDDGGCTGVCVEPR